MKNSRA